MLWTLNTRYSFLYKKEIMETFGISYSGTLVSILNYNEINKEPDIMRLIKKISNNPINNIKLNIKSHPIKTTYSVELPYYFNNSDNKTESNEITVDNAMFIENESLLKNFKFLKFLDYEQVRYNTLNTNYTIIPEIFINPISIVTLDSKYGNFKITKKLSNDETVVSCTQDIKNILNNMGIFNFKIIDKSSNTITEGYVPVTPKYMNN